MPATRATRFPHTQGAVFRPGQDVSTIVGYEVEEMILKRLSGPHVPKYCGSGDLAIILYIAMEFVEGRNLATCIEEIADNPNEIARIGALIATALAAVHRQNVIHLDLKPDNIIISPRGAVLLDFGLSRHFDLPDLLGEESDVPMGTPAYIALGCIHYEAATGEKPFGEPASPAGMKRRIYHLPQPVRGLNKRVPRWLATVIAKCMEVDPARRYANAGNVAFDLTHVDQIVVAPETRTLVGGGENWLRRLFRKKPAVLNASRGARLASLAVLKTEIIGSDGKSAAKGRSAHVNRLVALWDWAQPLGQLTCSGQHGPQTNPWINGATCVEAEKQPQTRHGMGGQDSDEAAEGEPRHDVTRPMCTNDGARKGAPEGSSRQYGPNARSKTRNASKQRAEGGGMPGWKACENIGERPRIESIGTKRCGQFRTCPPDCLLEQRGCDLGQADGNEEKPSRLHP
jgi:Protein kinase domain